MTCEFRIVWVPEQNQPFCHVSTPSSNKSSTSTEAIAITSHFYDLAFLPLIIQSWNIYLRRYLGLFEHLYRAHTICSDFDKEWCIKEFTSSRRGNALTRIYP